jgi:hypothetical protein
MAMPPTQLVESLKKHRCILFVGSGLSVPAGFPDWPGLIKLLIKEAAGAYPEKADSLKSFATREKDPLLVAEYARSKLGKQPYNQLLQRIFGDSDCQPQPVHRFIAQTNYRAVITTNYDKLIETAITFERGQMPAVVTALYPATIGNVLFAGGFFVCKLHGDVYEPDTIILTSKDYDDLMWSYPHLRGFLQAIFLTYTLLFVGYSLRDSDFQLVLKELRSNFEGHTPVHYALLPSPHEFTAEHLKDSMNIQVIPYDPKDEHQEAIEFLAKLQKIAPYRGRHVPASATRSRS